jgi:cbb3-type cytochrome oxidase subunit 3
MSLFCYITVNEMIRSARFMTLLVFLVCSVGMNVWIIYNTGKARGNYVQSFRTKWAHAPFPVSTLVLGLFYSVGTIPRLVVENGHDI